MKPKTQPILSFMAMLMAILLGTTASLIMSDWMVSADAQPTADIASTSTIIFAEDGIAIRGTDAVAYFTEGKPIPGRQEFAYEWQGVTWLFSSAEHRDLFASNPRAYAPQYGGFCAYGMSYGALVSIMPEAWSIMDGKLYLNYSIALQKKWKEDTARYIDQANLNWLALKTK
ncbi:YHS domain-containing (seleno)protein [Acaryochloris marina NIES-2412]|uniref:YHS domain-containing (seleno)protein n=1 Tax=Acaryochloris marina TaxID=155978 RepID=UPI004058771D